MLVGILVDSKFRNWILLSTMITQPRFAVGLFTASIYMSGGVHYCTWSNTPSAHKDNQGCLQIQINVTLSLFSHSAFEHVLPWGNPVMFMLSRHCLYMVGMVPQQQKLDKILHVQRKRVYMQRKCDRWIISCCFHNPLITTAYLPQYHNFLFWAGSAWLSP